MGKSFLAVTSSGAIWNSDDPPRLLWQASPAVEVALSKDGAQLVIGNSDGTIEVRQLKTPARACASGRRIAVR